MSFDEVYSCIKLIRLLKETQKFVKFAKVNGEDAEELFDGYRLMVKTIQRFLLHDISEFDSCVNLEEDFTLYRVRFTGVQLNETTSECPKMILARNVTELLKKSWKSKNFKELKDSINYLEKPLFSIFDRIFSNAKLPEDFLTNKNELIKQNMRELSWTFLADTSRNVPHGYFVAFLNHDCDGRERTVKGYKFTLAFLVNSLFLDSDKEVNKILKLKDTWKEVDSSFSILRKISERGRKNCPINLLRGTLSIKRPSKDDFIELLNLKLYKNPNLNQEQRLREVLLWYHLETLPPNFFCSVGGLVYLLKGLISDIGEGKEVEIIRFIHPVRPKQNTYSYAILLRAGGFISDSSGWLLFLDMATDFSGQGSTNLGYVEDVLRKNKRWFNIKNFRIDFKTFKNNMGISEKGSISLSHENNKIKDKIGYYKQLSTELLVQNYLLSSGFEIKEWSYNSSVGEIDFIAKKNDVFYLIEVTTSLNLNDKETSKLVEEFSKKEKEIRKKFGAKKVRKCFYVLNFFYREHYKLLEKDNIKVMPLDDLFFEKIGTKTNLKKIRRIVELLRFNPNFPFY